MISLSIVSNSIISGLISGLIASEPDTPAQDDAGFYDIYGMVHRPWWQHPGLKIFLCGILILGIILLLARFLVKRKKEKKLTPWDKALRDIERIKSGFDPEKVGVAGQVGSQFYVELSKIIKNYLHERYGYDVLGKTDQELIVWAAHKPQLSGVHEMISQVLSGGEYIKFAGYQAAQEAVEQHALLAQNMVKQTIPEPRK